MLTTACHLTHVNNLRLYYFKIHFNNITFLITSSPSKRFFPFKYCYYNTVCMFYLSNLYYSPSPFHPPLVDQH